VHVGSCDVTLSVKGTFVNDFRVVPLASERVPLSVPVTVSTPLTLENRRLLTAAFSVSPVDVVPVTVAARPRLAGALVLEAAAAGALTAIIVTSASADAKIGKRNFIQFLLEWSSLLEAISLLSIVIL
jgi:hypothetical protein